MILSSANAETESPARRAVVITIFFIIFWLVVFSDILLTRLGICLLPNASQIAQRTVWIQSASRTNSVTWEMFGESDVSGTMNQHRADEEK